MDKGSRQSRSVTSGQGLALRAGSMESREGLGSAGEDFVLAGNGRHGVASASLLKALGVKRGLAPVEHFHRQLTAD